MEYKGYTAQVVFSPEDKVLVGKIIGIVDSITFEALSVPELEQEFKNAVDDYLEFCEEVGKSPDKPYKGQFNVRIDPSLHRQMAIKATLNGTSLNQEVENAIREYLENKVIMATLSNPADISAIKGFNSITWNDKKETNAFNPKEKKIMGVNMYGVQ